MNSTLGTKHGMIYASRTSIIPIFCCFLSLVKCLTIIHSRDEAFESARFLHQFPGTFLRRLYFCHSASSQIQTALEFIMVRFGFLRTRESATHPPQPEDQRYSIWIWLCIVCCALVSAALSIRLFWGLLCSLVQLHRWRGYKPLSFPKHWWSSGRDTSPEFYLADVSASPSDATVAAAC